jgi:tetratricopeptide (TPR) repeat protein
MDSKEVSTALERILVTPAFVRSPRLAQFLRFAVEQRLSGRADSPKEFEIGVQVFGRPSDYDSRIDPVVRVQARLLRFKLHEYYETVGKNDPLRIELPKGGYLASFSCDTVPEPAIAPPDPVVRRWVPRSPTHRRWLAAAGLIAAALATVLVSWGGWKDAVAKVWANTVPSHSKAQSPAAQLYLEGRYYWSKRTPEDLHKAEDYFMQAVVADPGYAKAYVGLADCYGLLREFAGMPDSEAWPRALAASRKAVELDDSLAEAHSSLGFDLFYGSLDLQGGEREFKRALELNPNYAQVHQWYANALMALGRLAEASDEMERARELEPGSRSILADQSLLLFYQGKSGQAIDQLHRIEIAEPAFRSAHVYLAYIYFVARDCRDYLEESRKAAESSSNPVELAIVAAAQQGFNAGGAHEMLESLLQAQKKFADDGRYPGFQVAETFAMLGRKREALEYLNSSYKNREIYMVALNVAPTFASLRTEPQYRDLVARLGLDGPN